MTISRHPFRTMVHHWLMGDRHGGRSMAAPVVNDILWLRIAPLLPPARPRRRRFPGRKPLHPRRALTGILFVLKTGIAWSDLPCEMGCGSGVTCWRYLRAWKDRKSTRLNSSHANISYAVFCLKKKRS